MTTESMTESIELAPKLTVTEDTLKRKVKQKKRVIAALPMICLLVGTSTFLQYCGVFSSGYLPKWFGILCIAICFAQAQLFKIQVRVYERKLSAIETGDGNHEKEIVTPDPWRVQAICNRIDVLEKMASGNEDAIQIVEFLDTNHVEYFEKTASMIVALRRNYRNETTNALFERLLAVQPELELEQPKNGGTQPPTG